MSCFINFIKSVFKIKNLYISKLACNEILITAKNDFFGDV